MTVFAVAQGLCYPLLSFILERQGWTSGMIGLSAAMMPLGFILSAPVIPPLVNRFGAGPVALGCAVLGAVFLALIGWIQDFWLWFPLRFLLGFVVNPLYVISETWMIAHDAGVAAGQGHGRLHVADLRPASPVGPLALAMVGTEGWPPFVIGIAAFAGCAALPSPSCCRACRPSSATTMGGRPVAGFLPLAPLLLVAVTCRRRLRAGAAGDRRLRPRLRQCGRRGGGVPHGLHRRQHRAAGAARRCWPNASARRHAGLCAAVVVAGCALLPVPFTTPLDWPLAFVWGAAALGIYTMALVELGNRFSGATLIAGNAAFAMFWGVGGIAVPPFSGAVMDAIGVQGLPLSIGLLFALLLAGYVATARRRG